ncbi:deferrochelatase/peroxidase EfeB [Frankia sp. CNm7]|uniref:Deferrochelatase n=1 Tax=Frankia nepalensis TaxID=1836974 RepID=A0A937RDG7_9ACTN|nr:iron uptake transporter deferrochelatase/peroxidase subunit [Frankia nepalensis]MBL7495624.1 deferrochelatase/peroxidase EfeB [Frankia nepalensis]MBL7508870.1 deferrochelatase/peroxidase EfeB [Frankia nepalensis]MBL7520318.1 deferrochelatase/peroxidase EfeB [Frankia nepalensis]MBL7630093.1 deferrochelatase/peroxidase EfeB [Frankia nepalensis]
MTRVSRRGLLLGGAAAGGAALGGGGVALALRDGDAPASADADEQATYPFEGEHQAGITTPVQRHLYFAAYDLTANATRDDLRTLLEDWTEAARHLAQGREVGETGAVGGSPLAPPEDTGEALGLGPNGLTITFGLGPALFEPGRLGLEKKRPALFEPLPSFALELLDEATSGGDLCVQACANDPQVAVHAIRNLSRIAFGRAQIRWAQLGYGRTSSTTRDQATPRNLMGFKDGTRNIKADEADELAAHVWSGGEGQDWFAGGTYLVTRKIQMLIESWDRTRLDEQEAIIGRDKGKGAPLSGDTEFTEPDFEAVSTATGDKAIPMDAHVRLAHPDFNTGQRMLRRGYNYVEGNNALGQTSAGLFFIAFQKSPRQFIDIQNALARDPLNEYIRHVASGFFAVPRGVRGGEHVAQDLFA